VINAVDISALTLTESAYYFATTPTNLALPGMHSKGNGNELCNKGSEENKKKRHNNNLKETKKDKGKRKGPENGDKSAEGESNDVESGHDVRKEEKKNDEEEPCTVCNREYEEGDKMIQCDGNCRKWYHIECAEVSQEEFDRFSKDKKGVWKCCYCSKGLPAPSHCKLAGGKNPSETGRKRKKINYK